ncbi:hypothetical protein [Mesorhizobium sp. M0013]|uniref:hypothetical protein n=1 Tax=Mesorhizobium sp. M0013 TaxID=2956841 RepID=UPI00333D0529
MAKAKQTLKPIAASSAPLLPLPPEEISFRRYVDDTWKGILKNWRRGWASDNDLSTLDDTIEFTRNEIFVKKVVDPRPFDWERDWLVAHNIHLANLDLVRNHKQHLDDLKKLWGEWTERSYKHIGELSLEALRSMVLIDGAAIIASLAVLSGQISSPWHAAVLVAKLTVFTSVVSLLMMGAGHSLITLKVGDLVGRIRGVLVGNTKHNKLYAVPRYLSRYLDPYGRIANLLIYGSISVFGISAFISAIILMVSEGPSVLPH